MDARGRGQGRDEGEGEVAREDERATEGAKGG